MVNAMNCDIIILLERLRENKNRKVKANHSFNLGFALFLLS